MAGTPVVDRSLLESKADFYTLGSGLGFLPGLLAAVPMPLSSLASIAIVAGFSRRKFPNKG